MNPILKSILDSFVTLIKNNDSVLGIWYFGSLAHGNSDEYSDVDIVLLIDGKEFKHIENVAESCLRQACDSILLCWPEEFNGEAIINNGYIIEKDGNSFQFDIFLMNSLFIDDFMCSIHYTGLKESDIIFDKNNNVNNLILKAPKAEFWQDDVKRLSSTYWYHAHMTAKYLLRKDYFKLNHIMQILFNTHASLLLTQYDEISWGGIENKLHHIPDEKQNHLKKYYCNADFALVKNNLLEEMKWFTKDLTEICSINHIEINHIANKIISYWTSCTQNIK